MCARGDGLDMGYGLLIVAVAAAATAIVHGMLGAFCVLFHM